MTYTPLPRSIPGASDIPMHGWAPYADIHRERIRAHHKHEAKDGSMERKSWDNPIFLSVVGEEYGEVCRVLNEHELGNEDDPRPHLLEELIQLGAMTAAWIDAVQHSINESLAAAYAARRGDDA